LRETLVENLGAARMKTATNIELPTAHTNGRGSVEV
jgi:hypothetical protein